jgi:PPOX class probable F420-dependent enzyme
VLPTWYLLKDNILRKEVIHMHTFTIEERTFLLYGTRTGKLATVRKDGRPHVVPVWFTLDGDTIVFTTGEHSVKAANIRRDPRVSFCVDDETPPYAYILIEGIATLSEDLEALREWATAVGGRYMGLDQAEAFGKRNGVPGELLVRITPTRVIFEKEIAG